MKKTCLVYEQLNSVSEFQIVESTAPNTLRMSGVFGVCGVRNQNKRIYEKGNYGKFVEELQQEILRSGLPGELEHPNTMNINLENISHKIENIQMNEDGTVTGTICLLDTPKGKIAKALVEGGLPLYISSRGAGSIDENGNVTLTTLKTYDLVGTPGFSQARLDLDKNQKFESLNENLCIIYEDEEDEEDEEDKDDEKDKDTKKDTDSDKDDKDKKEDDKDSDKDDKDSDKDDDDKDDKDSDDKDKDEDDKDSDKDDKDSDDKDKKDVKESKDDESDDKDDKDKKEDDKDSDKDDKDSDKDDDKDDKDSDKDDKDKDDDKDSDKDDKKSKSDTNMKEIKETVDTLKKEVEELKSQLHIANENLNELKKKEVNYEAIEKWVNEEFAPKFRNEICEGVEGWVTNEFAPIVEGWVNNEFAPMVEGWVTNEFAPMVEGWVNNEFAPIVEGWVSNEFAPMVEGWVTNEFAPIVEGWVNNEFAPVVEGWVVNEYSDGLHTWIAEEFSPVVDKWINEEVSKELNESVKTWCKGDFAKEVYENVNEYLAAKPDEVLKSVDSMLEAIQGHTQSQEAAKAIDEAMKDRFSSNPIVAGMPTEYKPLWNMCTEAKKDDIIARSRLYDFSKAGVMENFWSTIDFESEPTAVQKPITENKTSNEYSNYQNSVIATLKRMRGNF